MVRLGRRAVGLVAQQPLPVELQEVANRQANGQGTGDRGADQVPRSLMSLTKSAMMRVK